MLIECILFLRVVWFYENIIFSTYYHVLLFKFEKVKMPILPDFPLLISQSRSNFEKMKITYTILKKLL